MKIKATAEKLDTSILKPTFVSAIGTLSDFPLALYKTIFSPIILDVKGINTNSLLLLGKGCSSVSIKTGVILNIIVQIFTNIASIPIKGGAKNILGSVNPIVIKKKILKRHK